MTLTYLDPSADPVDAEASMSDRPGSLEGVTVGLLDNGKTNAEVLLGHIAEELSEGYSALEFEFLGKPSPFKPAPEDRIRDVAVTYGAVITGVGD